MFGAKLLAAVGLEAVQRIRQGMEGSDCGAGAEFVLRCRNSIRCHRSATGTRTALLPCEIDKAVIMADSVRHGYLLRGVEMKYDDTELMVGYDTLEFETYDVWNIILPVSVKLCV